MVQTAPETAMARSTPTQSSHSFKIEGTTSSMGTMVKIAKKMAETPAPTPSWKMVTVPM